MPRLFPGMRIVHLLAGGGVVGGLEKHVIDLAAAQAARGLDARVVTTASLAPHFTAGVPVVPVRLDRPRWDPR